MGNSIVAENIAKKGENARKLGVFWNPSKQFSERELYGETVIPYGESRYFTAKVIGEK